MKFFFSESTEYWCGQNLIDGAVTAIQTQILVGAALSDPKEQAALKVNSKMTIELLRYIIISYCRSGVKNLYL